MTFASLREWWGEGGELDADAEIYPYGPERRETSPFNPNEDD